MTIYASPSILIWTITALATAGVIFRPLRLPEAIWAVAGALLVVSLGLVPLPDAWSSVLKGNDVYFFLTGMMLLSEIARKEGLFDWLAAIATGFARGSPTKLFALVYGIGILVTVFLSNDATAVVLTPAVYAATRVAKVRNPMPYLLICAFIANAASFVLPISNPANLVVFAGDRMPPLQEWLQLFLLPSIVAIAATFVALWLTQRKTLSTDTVANDIERPHLSDPAKIAGVGICATAIVLLIGSSLGMNLGQLTLLCGLVTTAVVLAMNRESPVPVLREISWSVLPLVAGLFVLVGALDRTGVIASLAGVLQSASQQAPLPTAAVAGAIVAFASNLVNNLPAALIAGHAISEPGVSKNVAASVLIGVDLGPNLSITGSLATILWLTALRREGLSLSAWNFLKVGVVVMPPALLLTLGSLLIGGV